MTIYDQIIGSIRHAQQEAEHRLLTPQQISGYVVACNDMLQAVEAIRDGRAPEERTL